MNIKFTVGEFASLHKISKQTLIYYDSIGLLHPNIINEKNGYRYYTTDQFEDLDTILMLKEVGIPLKSIREFLSQRNPKSTVDLLLQQKDYLSDKIEKLQLLQERLIQKVSTIIELEKTDINLEPILKKGKNRYLLFRNVAFPNDSIATDIELKRLLKQASSEGHIYNYQIGVMINKNNLLSGKFLSTEKVFTTIKKTEYNKNILHFKECNCACIFYKGSYDKIGNSYTKLLDFIKNNDLNIIDYSYEFCILDNLTTSDKNNYLTQIVIPVN